MLLGFRIKKLRDDCDFEKFGYTSVMFASLRLCLGTISRLFCSRRSLLLENLVLRQQLAVFKRRHPRPRLNIFDKLFWVVAQRLWPAWKNSVIAVTPETVVCWHRAGFRLYWRLISRVRRPVGRKRLSKEVRDLIFRMVAENPTWGALRIHGELLMLGFDVSERTISRWMRHAPGGPEPAKRWMAFLRNHREAIAAMDFFTVPTISFGVLYCFFVIGHDRRRILHFNVTKHPTSMWIVHQLREAFPFSRASQFLIFDRDAKYGLEVPIAIRSMEIDPVQTSYQSPWQNGVAERWVESCRRDLLNHVIALNEQHLKRLLTDYVSYYHEDRTHLGLAKQTPMCRISSPNHGHIISQARLGGLHHRYNRAA
jgi:transposase InsO family protein